MGSTYDQWPMTNDQQLKLVKEPDVIFIELSDIINAVLKHGDALDAHAKGKASVAISVIVHHLKHGRMDHAGAQDLKPARVWANAAAFAPADDTTYVHFRTGLCKRKKARTKPQACFLIKHLMDEGREYPENSVELLDEALDWILE